MDTEDADISRSDSYNTATNDGETEVVDIPEKKVEEPEKKRLPFLCRGIREDVRNRLKVYASDWTDGVGFRLLRPATYTFFASVIPALTFGEQLADDTHGQMGGAQILIATAMCGIIQALFGGQPLLIIGVAEPIILVYHFMYQIADSNGIPFRAFASCSLFWSSGMIFILAMTNACHYIHNFTRYSGETFGFLISVLFIQQGIKGLVKEFDEYEVNLTAYPALKEEDTAWNLFNGTWATFSALGLVWTSFFLREAKSWSVFNKSIRRIISDFSTFFMIVMWTLISYTPRNTPDNVPRRLKITDPLKPPASDTWSTLSEVRDLEAWMVGAAIIPAIVITVLYFFDHNVSAQLTQVKQFNLKKPHAYHWDFFLLGIMMVACALCGVPPANCVIPQSPQHTKNCSKIPEKRKSMKAGEKPAKPHVYEQRWTNIMQSLLCGVCIFITDDVLRRIPRSVLWGFFIYMGLEALQGSQFWERIIYLFSDRKLRPELLATEEYGYLKGVPLRVVNSFTMVQLFGLGVCYGFVWAGEVGIGFPILIMLMVPARISLFPKMFAKEHLRKLDPLEADMEEDDRLEEEAEQRELELQKAKKPTHTFTHTPTHTHTQL